MNISFHLTTPQFKARTKFVTRRLGWEKLVAGKILQAVEKGQGLKKGEKVKTLGNIIVLNVRREPLNAITKEDVILEGFPDMTTDEFIEFFCRANKCEPDTEVTRIEFGYLLKDEIYCADKMFIFGILGHISEFDEKDVADLQKINWLAKADYKKKKFCYQIKDILLTFFSQFDGYDLHEFDKKHTRWEDDDIWYSYHSHILERRKIEITGFEKPFVFHRPTPEFKYEVDNDFEFETRKISKNFEKFKKLCVSEMNDIKEVPENFDKREAVNALRRLIHKFKPLLRKQIEKKARAKYPFMQIKTYSNGVFDQFTVRVPVDVFCSCGEKLIVSITNWCLAKIKLGTFNDLQDWQFRCNASRFGDTDPDCEENLTRRRKNAGNSDYLTAEPYKTEKEKITRWAKEFFTANWDEIVTPLVGIEKTIEELQSKTVTTGSLMEVFGVE
jgi:hypothetical protein